MSGLNYKHLYYFWMVAKAGSIARASEQLHLTPQTISGQLSLFEAVQGEALFRKLGRNLELTEAGRLVLSYAEDIFALGQELEEVLHHRPTERTVQLRVGVSDALPKTVAYQLLEPALKLPQTLRINCREGKLESLLAELGMHKLDVVLSDSALPAHVTLRGYSHLLAESGVSFFATAAVRGHGDLAFPQCLDAAPFLLPGEDAAMRARLLQWFDEQGLHPRIAGEFDDSALMSAFGQAGAGMFAAPSMIADIIMRQYAVELIGQTEQIREQFYAISVQRKLTHPAVLAISKAAQQKSHA
ncbi:MULTISPECIES: transcriptional activator NhaR [unclassified Undibacterium]|uniref:transcriptional activator NhaR n=1 Tax=unclassified Undibacterium TaxID=2630295 RepID=UPI002AC8C34E|nr:MULTISPECIES: transcriptional activator NhaR [unclassified Undibacterium]MEB0137775.1 transcriptional activator NhaR [Undibacterium sp. CCC2.1]MEB0171034.1 transcriptional activator NhaR [Undibacterium sp. CCC1.1]MEB0175079.1 transcriptional activator NhaR [Undibacterium sp. CCC3.4]MEB0215143.1 transcriptional activator NhaR [Undibacterium sp. 5I2]WPX44883.1 transcriptional activator NhaR [Undibacterium sp. CCC3.4]